MAVIIRDTGEIRTCFPSSNGLCLELRALSQPLVSWAYSAQAQPTPPCSRPATPSTWTTAARAGLNGGTGGAVTLTQNGKNSVTVDILLNSSVDLFHSTNAFDSFAFDLVGNPAISVSNLTSGFALVSTTAG